MINATWDILEVIFIIFLWVETSNKTLEEIDDVIEGQMHFDAPILTAVMAGDYEAKAGTVVDTDYNFSKKSGEEISQNSDEDVSKKVVVTVKSD
jgi:hypothetical protein